MKGAVLMNRRLVGGALIAAAMTAGGVAGAVIGVPGVSAAQESDSPTTTDDVDRDDTGRGSDDGTTDRTCPDKDDADTTTGS
jgi:hypothetical protein